MIDAGTLTITTTVIDPDQIKALCSLTQLNLEECYQLGYEKLEALIQRIEWTLNNAK